MSRIPASCLSLGLVLLLAPWAAGEDPLPLPLIDAAGSPTTLFLTWDSDPTTTMTIQWLVEKNRGPRAIDWTREGNTDRHRAPVKRTPFGVSTLEIARVSLRGLEPGTAYEFSVEGSARTFTFRTAPATTPLTFAAGGDAGPSPATARTNQQAARCDPDFALLGGDIAYANGSSVAPWVEFLGMWHRQMRGPTGRLIPLVAGIGNHEVNRALGFGRPTAPFFYSLFPLFKSQGYAALDFGSYLSLILLDSLHTETIDGEQAEWLEDALRARADAGHLFVVYHVPSLPSHRPLDDPTAVAIRKHWVPLFEQFGVDAVFENHEHTYKRSPRLRGGAPSPAGVLYLGDGAWGANYRLAKQPEDADYIAASYSGNHFILTTLDGDRRHHLAIDDAGRPIDGYPLPPLEIELTTTTERRGEKWYASSRQPVFARLELTAASFLGHRIAGVRGSISFQDLRGRDHGGGHFELGPETTPGFLLQPPPPGRYRVVARGEVTFAHGAPSRSFALRRELLDFLDFAPRPAEEAITVDPGLRYSIFEGSWRFLPDFANLAPVASGVCPTIDLSVAGPRLDRFGIRFEGYVAVPTAGLYEFRVRSDDGSRLAIGETIVVDNDGQHAAREASGVIVLEAGLHPFQLDYFERRGAEHLEVEYRPVPGIRGSIPADRFAHEKLTED